MKLAVFQVEILLFLFQWQIEGLKTSTDNETYSPALELENLQRNGLSNVRTISDEQDGEQNGSGYEKTKFGAKLKSARPKFLPGR